MKIKQHSYSCPHSCEACKVRWQLLLWKEGGCIVCGTNRGGNLYGHDQCWDALSKKDQQEVLNLLEYY